jgi:hypothetical protein
VKPRIYWSFPARCWMWTAQCPAAGAHRSWAGAIRNLETHIRWCTQCRVMRERIERAILVEPPR